MAEELQEQTKSAPEPTETAILEALLFVAPGPVSFSQLADALSTTNRVIEKRLQELGELLADRGLRLQYHNNRVQITTAPECSSAIEKFLNLDATSRLSQAALEALSIVSYKQPVTRPQVDSIRGVNSDAVLKTLLHKGLIEESSRAETPGRPILYATTPEFLQHFGLESLASLPQLNLDPAVAVQPDEENGIIKE